MPRPFAAFLALTSATSTWDVEADADVEDVALSVGAYPEKDGPEKVMRSVAFQFAFSFCNFYKSS